MLSLLKQLFKLPESDWENLSLKYTDNENDKCTVTGDQELREAFHAKKDEVLKLELSFPAKKPELGQSSLVNAIRRRLLQEQLLQNQQPQPQQPQQLEARRCGGWPERVNQRRVTIFNLTEEGIALMDAHKYNEAKEIFTKQAEILKCPWKKSVPLYNIGINYIIASFLFNN